MGILDSLVGRAKETVGTLFGMDDLRREGQAQQRKGSEEDPAGRARLAATEHEKRADRHERSQWRQGS